MPFYLAVQEMLRNKFRFIAVSMIIGLITLLVLFVAAMGDGMTLAVKQYIENADAGLFVFQEYANVSIPASRLGRSRLNDINRVEGVEAVGPLGFSTASIVLEDGRILDFKVSLIGVEPGMPGAPKVFAGSELNDPRVNEVVLDQHVLDREYIPLGATIYLKVVQGTEEQFYPLKVVGHTEGQQYFFLPSIFVPLRVWDKIRPQDTPGGRGRDLIFNVAAIQLKNPDTWPEMIGVVERQVGKVEVADPVTTYESTEGYSDMKNILDTQQSFALLIALLVVGGFFQVQTLQKVAQIGMLKAIGTSNRLIVLTLIVQVMLTTTIGMTLGGLAVWSLSLMLPPGIPILFDGQKVILAVITLFVIGPLGGLVSVRTLVKIEPLKALGLGA